ncbi:hypothetical protein EDB81DRAFT_882025 [Dactylonectria macrodidyma]|uniref:F-box domain-containing protein n=1 Tax=Dactylonectria macrodidyma TaxID=307937 RepID=A0A9P9F5K3_9HYPO|nr:hypothetical protein EDB81DRAFT_882025 [Dactylonectria macrodidyma]
MAMHRMRRLVQQRVLGETADEDAITAAAPPIGHRDADAQPHVSGGSGKQLCTEECSVQGITTLIALSSRHDRFGNTKNALGRILELPPELQFMILRFLNFGDLERLRRSCHFFRDNITKQMVRELFPSLKYELLSTCYHCLVYDPLRGHLVRPDETHERYPFASECFDCVARGSGFMVGRKITLGDFTYVWVCRWCGYPISYDGAWNQPEFHHLCYRRFHKILFYFFLVGCAQWMVVIVGSALCWSFYRKKTMVLAPTIVNFFVAIWIFCLTLVRNEELRTYHFTLLLEVCVLLVWVPPLYAIVKDAMASDNFSKPVVATLSFVVLNMWFRVLNIMGNAILVSEYKLWRRHRPGLTLGRRVIHKIIAVLVFWTYPQSVEQVYPGTYRFRRRRHRPPWEV